MHTIRDTFPQDQFIPFGFAWYKAVFEYCIGANRPGTIATLLQTLATSQNVTDKQFDELRGMAKVWFNTTRFAYPAEMMFIRSPHKGH